MYSSISLINFFFISGKPTVIADIETIQSGRIFFGRNSQYSSNVSMLLISHEIKWRNEGVLWQNVHYNWLASKSTIKNMNLNHIKATNYSHSCQICPIPVSHNYYRAKKEKQWTLNMPHKAIIVYFTYNICKSHKIDTQFLPFYFAFCFLFVHSHSVKSTTKKATTTTKKVVKIKK